MLDKIIQDAFNKGEEKAKTTGIIGASWTEYFKLEYNPFISDNEVLPDSFSMEELFIDRENITTELAEYIGASKYTKNFYHIILTGPKGSGKSTIIAILEKYAKKNYKTLYLNVNENQSTEESIVDLSIALRSEKFECVFFDNCFPINRVELYINYRRNLPGLLISAIDPTIALDLEADRTIVLAPMENNIISQLLVKRVVAF